MGKLLLKTVSQSESYNNRLFTKKTNFFLLLVISISFFNLNLYGQQKTIVGNVTDIKGEPIPGVSVKLKNTAVGVTTDTDGQYVLKVPALNGTLVITYIGFIKQEIAINGRVSINVKLDEELTALNEIVVVGYGTQKKATLTGSVSSITGDEIRTTTNGNLSNMLAGKLAGLRVTQRTSAPGAYQSDLDIRGFGAPLVIIDGVPRDNFTSLDPNEIENISILKDASASVYGVKGGNGVILITTKQGKKGQPQFNYSSIFGIQTIANSPGVLDAYGYATLLNESSINVGDAPKYSKEELQQYKDGILPSYDWYNLVIAKYSPQMQHTLSASGASDKMSYFMSLGYFDETGIYKSGDINANRFNFRSNVTADLTKNLKATFMINGIKDYKYAPSIVAQELFKSLWRMKPTDSPFANENPDYLGGAADNIHPLAASDASIGGYNTQTMKTLNGSFALDYKVPFIRGMKARLMYAYDTRNITGKVWNKLYKLYDYDNATGIYNVISQGNSPTNLSQSFSENISTLAQASINYDKTILKYHNISALLLFEERKVNGDGFNGKREFSLDAVEELFAGNTENQTINSSDIDGSVNMGLVGRLNYNYKEKYLLEGSFRYDGSSKFAEDKRWGLFPAVSAGWRISEEPFLKNKFKFLDNLKLRASYGKLGDDASSTYQYLTGYDYPGNRYVFDGTVTSGLGFRGMANQDLTWYVSTLINIGVDADFWNGKLHAELDVFSKKREGILADRALTLPGTFGTELPQENLNSDLRKGFELVLSHHNNIGKLNYTIGGNISFTRGKKLYIEQTEYLGSYDNWKKNNSNRWDDIYWGYHVIGRFQSMDEIANSPTEDGKGNTLVLPGDFKYEDVNHDGVINGSDSKPIGIHNNTPEINFGLTLNLRWKGFDLNALFQGAARYTVAYNTSDQLSAPLMWDGNGLDIFMDRWHREDMFDPNSAWIPGKYPAIRKTATWNYSNSDWWLKDATYVRLKSLQIGYAIPASILHIKNIKTLRIYANGFNLITWSGLNDTIDPEHATDGGGTRYPVTKSYNLGINLNF